MGKIEDLLWVVMPLGSTHGWGVCGKHLALALSRLAGVKLVTEHFQVEDEYADPDDQALSHIFTPHDDLARFLNVDGMHAFEHPMLQAIEGANLKPWLIPGHSPKTVGYTFFEKNFLGKDDVSAAQQYFDWIVAGSTWCEGVLKASGIKSTKTVFQGVDTERFHPGYAEKKGFKDAFVVFSGGKMEFRKGQDLVIRAFKVLQDKYDDVMLVNCWHNRWDAVTATMSLSPHIRFEMPKGPYVNAVNHLLQANGIHPEKAVVLEPVSHTRMAEVYRDSDCGLFPNRCEGGTNLVLMEYMACGKPVIASNNSGHMDVLSPGHAMVVESHQPLNIAGQDGRLYASWYEPNLDEVISKLEWAYHHRDEIREIGLAGSRFISQFTWERAAGQFYGLLFGRNPLDDPVCQETFEKGTQNEMSSRVPNSGHA